MGARLRAKSGHHSFLILFR